MTTHQHPIIVVGAGGAGLIATWRIATQNVPVLLLERNSKAGIKLLISGGGKCNVTHAGSTEELLAAFTIREARFLKHAFYKFPNTDIVNMLHSHGVMTQVRPNGRIFPASERARDVVHVLEHCARTYPAEIRYSSPVEDLIMDGKKVTAVRVGDESIPSSHVILATGGMSYPRTGTTGDGFRWAAHAGHTIVPLCPALAPIGISPPLPSAWQGIALRAGRLSVVQSNRTLFSWDDDILFTHEGVSGPAALEVSRAAHVAALNGPAELRFDFFPQTEFNVLDRDLLTRIDQRRARTIGTLLESWLPNRLVGVLLQSLGVDPTLRGHSLTRDARRKIVTLLKNWTIGIIGKINIDRGEVTAGGVSLDEVDPRSMRSRKAWGLYLCGEVLDVAGPVGGFNLQVAFSTGFVAGESAARDWLGNSHAVDGVT